jgi:type IV secretion system protein VirB6
MIDLSHFATELLAMVDNLTGDYVYKSYNRMVQYMLPVIGMMLSFYLVIQINKIKNYRITLNDAINHAIKVMCYITIATTWAVFFKLFYHLFTQVPLDLMKVLSVDNAPSDLGNALDESFQKGIELAFNFFSLGWGLNASIIGYWMSGIFVLGSTLIYTMIAIASIVLSKLMLAIFLPLAPMIFPLLMFEQSKSFFERWLQNCINFALLPVIISAVTGLILSITQNFLTEMLNAKTGGLSITVPMIKYVAMTIPASLLYYVAHSKAAALSSGFSIMGLSSAAQTLKSMGSHASNVYQGTRQASSQTYTQAKNHYQNAKDFISSRAEEASKMAELKKSREGYGSLHKKED